MRMLVSLLSEPELEKNTCVKLRSATLGAKAHSLVASFTAGTLVVLKKLL